MIRLIALDLDQTVFGADLIVSPRVRTAVARAMAAGVVATVATGRESRLATRFARDLGITAPLVCAQGGCIYDHVQDRVLRDVRLSAGLLPAIIEAAGRYSWNFHFEMSDRLFFPEHSNHPPVLFELLRYSNWVRVGDLLLEMPEPPHKLIVTLDSPADLARTTSEMEAAFGGRVTIVHSHPHLVEGLPPGVSKGPGLAWLAEHLGIPRAEVMAIGDSDADAPMLEWAGIGVAMGNATPEAKEVCDWVAPALDQDGAAVAIERFVLSG